MEDGAKSEFKNGGSNYTSRSPYAYHSCNVFHLLCSPRRWMCHYLQLQGRCGQVLRPLLLFGGGAGPICSVCRACAKPVRLLGVSYVLFPHHTFFPFLLSPSPLPLALPHVPKRSLDRLGSRPARTRLLLAPCASPLGSHACTGWLYVPSRLHTPVVTVAHVQYPWVPDAHHLRGGTCTLVYTYYGYGTHTTQCPNHSTPISLP